MQKKRQETKQLLYQSNKSKQAHTKSTTQHQKNYNIITKLITSKYTKIQKQKI